MCTMNGRGVCDKMENVASTFIRGWGTANVTLLYKGDAPRGRAVSCLHPSSTHQTPLIRMDGFLQSSSFSLSTSLLPLSFLSPSSLFFSFSTSLLLLAAAGACVFISNVCFFLLVFFFSANAGCSPRKTRAAKARSQSPSRARRRRRTRLRNLPPRAPVEVPYPSPPNPAARCEPPRRSDASYAKGLNLNAARLKPILSHSY